MREGGFELDLGLHLKSLVAFTTGQSRFLTVGGLRLDALQAGWKESCRGMEFALNFLKSNAGIDSPALLSSPFMLIALAYHGHKRDYTLSAEESDRLRYWVLAANAKGRYSRGSSETILDQDLATLRSGGGARELIDRLRQQVGRLDIAPRSWRAETSAARSSRRCSSRSARREPRTGGRRSRSPSTTPGRSTNSSSTTSSRRPC